MTITGVSLLVAILCIVLAIVLCRPSGDGVLSFSVAPQADSGRVMIGDFVVNIPATENHDGSIRTQDFIYESVDDGTLSGFTMASQGHIVSAGGVRDGSEMIFVIKIDRFLDDKELYIEYR